MLSTVKSYDDPRLSRVSSWGAKKLAQQWDSHQTVLALTFLTVVVARQTVAYTAKDPCREYLPTFPLVHVAIFH